MLKILSSRLCGVASFTLLLLNTLVGCLLVCFLALVRVLLPFTKVRQITFRITSAIGERWIDINGLWMRLAHPIDWHVTGLTSLDTEHWYAVSANHQSWADVFVVQHLLNRRAPSLKFFVKQELIWVPLLGVTCWALEFPFMKRYSREYLERHPEKRGDDFRRTRVACEKFRYTPVAIFNFMEGTRYTKQKAVQQNTPYRYLLKPKAGGLAYVIGAMDNQIDQLIDLTIHYPDHQQPSFWDFLCGRVNHIMVDVKVRDIPEHFKGRNYQEDDLFRNEFQVWVSEIWDEKEKTMYQLHEKSLKRGWSHQRLHSNTKID